MQKRKVVTRFGNRMRGYYNYAKEQTTIPWESGLEKKAARLFAYSPGVKRFSEYQTKIVYYDGAEQRDCYIDFIVELHSTHKLLVEIKPQRKLADPEVRKKYSLISDRVKQLGMHFLLLTDEQLDQEPRLSNLIEIDYHRPRKICKSIEIKRTQLEAVHLTTFEEAAERLGSEMAVWRMLSSLRLSCDLSQTISPKSIIKFAEDDHDSLLF